MSVLKSIRPMLLALALVPAACRIEPVQRSERVSLVDVAREDMSVVLDAYRDALLRADAAGVAAAFTPDGQLQMPDAPDVVGTGQIRDAMAEVFTSLTPTDLLLEREQVDVADGVAYELGRFEETIRTAADSVLELRGRYAIRWRRGPEAQWRIERMLINHYPPADTATSR